MPVPYQNNMYPQMPYGQQQYGVNSYLPYMQPRFQQPEVPAQQVQQQTPPVQQMPRGLNGMVVQAIENVTADCVPMDGSAAFFFQRLVRSKAEVLIQHIARKANGLAHGKRRRNGADAQALQMVEETQRQTGRFVLGSLPQQ